MVNQKVIPFFCDECGKALSTASLCPKCRRVLCHKHYYGSAIGPSRRKDGLCVKCAKALEVEDGKTEQA